MTINFLSAFFFLSNLTACDEEIVVETNLCSVEITDLPDLESEQEQRLYARPLSEVWDTYLSIDGIESEVIAVNRSGCSSCDECRIEFQCTQCETCDACEEVCLEQQCIEELQFITPALSTEQVQVRLINKYGQSQAYTANVAD